MKRYLIKIKEWAKKFKILKITQIPHTSKAHTDALNNLSLVVLKSLKRIVLVSTINEPSVRVKEPKRQAEI